MTVGDVLDGAFKLLKANVRTLLLIVAAITVPLQLVSAFVVRETFSPGILNVINDPSVAERAANQQSSGGEVAVQLIAALLGLLATPFIAGAVSRVVAASYLGEQIGPAEALKVAGRRFGALLGAFFLVHLAEVVGGVLCVLPGIALMAMFSLTAPAIAVEEIGPIQGMRRSWNLVKRRFWPVLGISLLAGLIASMLGNILGTAPQLVGLLVGGRFAWLLVAIGAVLTSLVTAPVVSIVATLVYFDGRIRHEGFDLQVIAANLGRA